MAPVPTLAIDDVTVTEGNDGTENAVFHVTLSTVYRLAVSSVDYATDNGTATAGSDYTVSGSLTFAARRDRDDRERPHLRRHASSRATRPSPSTSHATNATIADTHGAGDDR